MAIARNAAELSRWSDLAIIRRATAARMPELDGRAGLSDVAELCRRHGLAHPGRDWNDVRDDMLMICCEWDLANDSLDAQSDACFGLPGPVPDLKDTAGTSCALTGLRYVNGARHAGRWPRHSPSRGLAPTISYQTATLELHSDGIDARATQRAQQRGTA